MSQLKTYAIDFAPLMQERTRDFTGREWVFQRVETWLADPGGSRVFLLTGGPGTGKSSIAARLAQMSLGEVPGTLYPRLVKDSLAYFHFCQAQSDASLNPLRFVEALSAALANRYEPFAKALVEASHRDITVVQNVGAAQRGSQVTGIAIQSLRIGNLSARAAFDWAVRRPLEALCAPGFGETIVVLTDSLDEALIYNADENITLLLVDVTATEQNLPIQVRFLLTSRPDPRILDLLGKPSVDLVTDAPADADDVRAYALRRLSVLPESARSDLAGRIAAAGRGNFLYARYVLDDLVVRPEAVVDLETMTLPDGLDDIYRQFIRRELARTREAWGARYRPLLGLLTVARNPGLMREHLVAATGLLPSQTDDALAACKQYLAGDLPDGPFALYHQSFRELLLRDPKLNVYPTDADLMLGETLVQAYEDGWASCDDDYALRNTPGHLAGAAQTMDRPLQRGARRKLEDALCRTLLDFGFLEAKARRIGANALLADIRTATATIPASADLSALEKVIDREIINLDRWKSRPGSVFFAQQIFNRAKAFGLEALAARAATRLSELGAPYLEALWRISNESPALQRRHGGIEGGVAAIALTPDGSRVVFAAPEDVLHIWTLDTGEKQQSRGSQSGRSARPASGLALSADGAFAFTSGELGLRAWSLHDLKEVWNSPIGGLDGQFALVPGSEHGTAVDLVMRKRYSGLSIGTLDFSNGVYQERKSIGAWDVTALALTRDGRRFITGGRFGTTRTRDLQTYEHEDLPIEPGGPVRALAVTHDGKCLISGAGDGTLRVRNLVSGKQIRPLEGHRYGITAVAVTPDGKRAISGSRDNTVWVWDLESGQQIERLYGHDAPVSAIVVTADGKRAVSSDWNGQLILWDLAGLDVARMQTLSTHIGIVNEIKTVPGGRLAVTASGDGTLGVWDLAMRKRERVLDTKETPLTVAIFQDGQHVVSGGTSGNVTIWDLITGQQRCSEHGHEGAIWMVAATADGDTVISASTDQNSLLKVWQVVRNGENWSLRHIHDLKGHKSDVTGVAVAEATRRIVSASKDGSVRVWHLDTGKPLGKMRGQGHEAAVLTVVTTPDGRRAISSAENGSLRVWDLAKRQLVRVLAGHTTTTWGLAVSPSGKRLVSASWDDTFKVWDLETGREIAMMAVDVRAVCVSFVTETTIVVGDFLGSVGCFQISGIDR